MGRPTPVPPPPLTSGAMYCTDCITQYLNGTLQTNVGVTTPNVAVAWFKSPTTGVQGNLCWSHISIVGPTAVP